jgi:hypothetical protein
MTISNTNEWNTYITETLRCGGLFTMLLWLRTKAATTEVVTVEEEEQLEWKGEGRTNEGEEAEPGVVECMIDFFKNMHYTCCVKQEGCLCTRGAAGETKAYSPRKRSKLSTSLTHAHCSQVNQSTSTSLGAGELTLLKVLAFLSN